MLHARFLAATLALAACIPAELPLEGLACDEAHACPGALVCCHSICVSGDGGYAWPAAPQHVTWRQWADGFDAVQTPPRSSVSVGLCNEVSASIDDSSVMQAVASVTDLSKLPSTRAGKLRGTFTVTSALSLQGNSGFVVLMDRTGSKFLLSTAINFDDHLAYYSAPAELIASDAFGNGDTKVTASEPHALEVRWKQSGFIELVLDGHSSVYARLDAGFTGADAVPSELRLGINHYNAGNSQPGWALKLRDFELSDDPDAGW